jgi:hypothetical protein
VPAFERFASSPEFAMEASRWGLSDLLYRPGEDRSQLEDLLHRPGEDITRYETLPITPQTPSAGWEQLSGASFDVKVPYVPGRSLEGVPNADTPEMREKIRRRLLLNPGGKEDLPGFLKRALIPTTPLG